MLIVWGLTGILLFGCQAVLVFPVQETTIHRHYTIHVVLQKMAFSPVFVGAFLAEGRKRLGDERRCIGAFVLSVVLIHYCIKADIWKLTEIRLSPTFPKDHPEREASGGAILRPCWRIPIMLAVLVPCHSRRWLPGTPQLAKRSASPERETLKTALISNLWCPPREQVKTGK